MPVTSLTEIAVERAKPANGPAGRYELWDRVLPGFGLRVQQSGAKSFFVMYRVGGKQRRLTLGRYPVMKLAKAREAARQALESVQSGDDPGKAISNTPGATLMGEVLELYISRRLKPNLRATTAGEAERALRKDFETALGHYPIGSITRAEIFKLLDGIVDRGAPVHANRVLTLIKTFFNWSVERGYIEVSPAAPIKPPTREITRDRVLDVGELVRVWRACDELGPPFGTLVRLLILTGQRRDEVGEMRWSEVDFEKAIWTIPSSRTKNGVEHEVQLSPEVVAMLCGLDRVSSDLVFSTTGVTPVSGWSRMKRRLDGMLASPSPPAPWTLHDLRRSAATNMAELGLAPHVIDKILNHTQGAIAGVARIYNRHSYKSERRAALEEWSRYLMDRLHDRVGNVVLLRG